MSDTPDLSFDELLAKVAEVKGMPASLAQRSAEGRAKKSGESVEDVLKEWAGIAPAAQADTGQQTSDTETDDREPTTDDGSEGSSEPSELEQWTADLAERVGAQGFIVEFDTPRILVDRDKWVDTILAAYEELPFFSWLSAIDWSKDVEVGETVEDPDSLEERFEVLCMLSSVENADAATFVATLPKDDATIGSLDPHIGGASWHEREAHDMFGIDFAGHSYLAPIYLPDDFIGNPLLKSYPLISREVKPWPGDVDVEGLPATDDQGGDA